jgi:F-type H+-transporting ATPase subunit epsilon
MADLQVQILTPAKVVAKTAAAQVQLPGSLGYMGILPGHTKLVAELGVGELTVDAQGGKQSYFIAGGFVDVANDQVTVLVDVAEKPGDINRERAEKAKQRALDRLAQKTGVDVMRAQASLLRAEGRLAISARR